MPNMLFTMQYDVGVDNNEFAPVSLATVRNIINKQIKDDGNDAR